MATSSYNSSVFYYQQTCQIVNLVVSVASLDYEQMLSFYVELRLTTASFESTCALSVSAFGLKAQTRISKSIRFQSSDDDAKESS